MAKGKTTGKQGNETGGEKTSGSIVLAEFRDKNDFSKLYTVGQDISKLPESRLAELRAKGLVGESKEEPSETENDE